MGFQLGKHVTPTLPSIQSIGRRGGCKGSTFPFFLSSLKIALSIFISTFFLFSLFFHAYILFIMLAPSFFSSFILLASPPPPPNIVITYRLSYLGFYERGAF